MQPGQLGHLAVQLLKSSLEKRPSVTAACLAWPARNALARSVSEGPLVTPQQNLTLRPLPHRHGWLRPWAAIADPLEGPAATQEQPLVLPQEGQAWQLPERIICTPHCMQ